MTRMSESKRRSLAAIGDTRVIPGERERGPGSKLLRIRIVGPNLGPGSVTKMSRDDDLV